VGGLKEVIPAHTIVGSAIRGDYTGATTRAVKYATPLVTSMVAGQQSQATAQQAAAQAAAQGGITSPGGVLGPGGFVEKNQTILLLVAAGLGIFLLMGKRKGRK